MKNVFELHQNGGALEIKAKLPIMNKEDLGLAYTPGISKLCTEIHNNSAAADKYTIKGKLVAIITDGSAVLGLGNIGPKAGLPVVEGKALLDKQLAGIDAIPLCIRQCSVHEQVETIMNMAGSFSAIHLEDFKAPECFELERQLQAKLSIPVHHDDQDGTSIAVLAALINSCKITHRKIKDCKIVICGAGASGIATARLLLAAGALDIILTDINGIISPDLSKMNDEQQKMAYETNPRKITGTLKEALVGADVFIGLSTGNVITNKDIKRMNDQPIIFALANPIPEIDPVEAKQANAAIVATGGSKYPNQINNVLVFPGLFKGLLHSRKKTITKEMKLKIAYALAGLVDDPTENYIIPDVFDERVVSTVCNAVINS